MINSTALTVSQINYYIKSLFDADYRLANVCVSGEISNFVHHYRTGHCYFTLKDEASSIKCVMFAFNAKRLIFDPEDGMKVIVKGKVSVYERDGNYQIYVDDMQPDGAGVLAVAFEQLKNKLTSEGLFDESKKKSLPAFPQKIGVVTSDTGAAVRDVINVLSRRYPLAEVVLYPVTVQGVECAVSNVRAINYFNDNKNVDVIIICRGGGSIEDLWGYNDERLVRSVAKCEIPVISGVGHEVDFTLCDFAADLRAPTPSAAAELCVPNCSELLETVNSLTNRSKNGIELYVKKYTERINIAKINLMNLSPVVTVKDMENRFNIQMQKLNTAINNGVNQKQTMLDGMYDKLILLNPVKMLKNGNLLAFKGKIRLKSVNDICENDEITMRFFDGSAKCTVTGIKSEEKYNG